MTYKTRGQYVEVGQHSSTDPSDFDTAPSVVFMQAVGEVVPTGGYEALDRDADTGDGAPVGSVKGAQNLAVPDLTFELTGLSGGGAGDSTNTSSLSLSVDPILECLVGAAATDEVGETTAASPGTGTTVTIDAATGFSDDAGIAFATATAGNIVCRAVVSTSSADITVDRAPTDQYGATEAPAATSVVYAMRRYAVTPATVDMLHYYVDLEGPNGSWRYQNFGVAGDYSLEFSSGQIAKLNLTGQQCMKYERGSAQSPTYSAAATGSKLITYGSQCWIDSTLYQAHSLTVEGGNTIAPRTADGGEQGNYGYVTTGRAPMLKFTLRAGGLTTPTELTDAALETFRGDTTVDLSFQIGRAAGGLCYVRARSANIKASSPYKSDNGQLAVDVEAECTGAEPLDIYFG